MAKITGPIRTGNIYEDLKLLIYLKHHEIKNKNKIYYTRHKQHYFKIHLYRKKALIHHIYINEETHEFEMNMVTKLKQQYAVMQYTKMSYNLYHKKTDNLRLLFQGHLGFINQKFLKEDDLCRIQIAS